MIIYESVFLISTLVIWIGYRKNKKNIFLGILACVILILLYSFADFTSISDRVGYGSIIWTKVEQMRDKPFSWIKGSGQMETGYLFINYIVAKYASSINLLYFILGSIQVFCAFFSIHYLRNQINVTVTWFAYQHLMFLPAIAQIRQGVAVAYAIIVFSLLFNKKYKSAICFFILGIVFDLHTSYVVVIIYFVFTIIINLFRKSFTVSLLLSSMFSILIPFAAEKISPKLFNRYIIGESEFMGGQTTATFLLVLSLFVLAFLTIYRETEEFIFVKNRKLYFNEKLLLITSLFTFYLILFLQPIISQAYRIREYFMIGTVIGFGYFLKKIPEKFKFIGLIFVFFTIMFYVILIYYSKNYAHLLPYKITIDRK